MPNGRTQMNQAIPAKESITVIGEGNGLQLAIKHTIARGLGEIISRPDSPNLIDGVVVEPLQVHPDDRGFFVELARLGSEGIAARMMADGRRQIQISTTLTYPGTIPERSRPSTITTNRRICGRQSRGCCKFSYTTCAEARKLSA